MNRFLTLLVPLLLAGCATGGASPYAGEQLRATKALSEAEVRALLEGQGMGYAKAAELNGYPGPMHVLENADALKLTALQREQVTALMSRHKAEARAIGAGVVQLERDLDRVFAQGGAKPEDVDRLLAAIATEQAKLRGSHLKTHLATTELMTKEQVLRYIEVRGYGSHSH